jgi:hypothetical protein
MTEIVRVCSQCLARNTRIVFVDPVVLRPRETLEFDLGNTVEGSRLRIFKGLPGRLSELQVEMSLCKNCAS